VLLRLEHWIIHVVRRLNGGSVHKVVFVDLLASAAFTIVSSSVSSPVDICAVEGYVVLVGWVVETLTYLGQHRLMNFLFFLFFCSQDCSG